MVEEKQIPLRDLVISLTNTVDLVSPILVNHHKKVAFISYCLAEEMGLTGKQRNDLLLAGALHDIGGLSLQDRIDVLSFESLNPHYHSENGYALLNMFQPFKHIADIVRFHHVPWNEGRGAEFRGREVPLGSHILHLADRIAVLINRRKEILGQVEGITAAIQDKTGKMFHPQLVEVYRSLAGKEAFWLDLASNNFIPSLKKYQSLNLDDINLNMYGILDLSQFFAKIIDFRSSFTANHSSGVAASAEALARLTGFTEQECLMMKVAGFLHDLGKLAVPTEILEKPGKLNKEELNVVRSHTFYTYQTLKPITELETINKWASFHHERLDGSGYPFHLSGEQLCLGSRIMAVADVFTAITEDRPYRKGMDRNKSLKILKEMAKNLALDYSVVDVLEKNYDDINDIRSTAQETSGKEYRQFLFSTEKAV